MLVEVPLWRVGLAYLMLIAPLSLFMWTRVPLVAPALVAVVRMTLQLLFVGLYLQVVFQIDKIWLTGLWMLVMVVAADLSAVRGAGLKPRHFAVPVFAALVIGAIPPLLYFLGPVLGLPGLIRARYAIPLFGMILGNCMRASIVGLRTFYQQVRAQERFLLHSLAQGATLSEALVPFVREAYFASLSPTVQAITTIGLVSLPGMMTGVVLTGASPFTAVKYQTVIMLSILTGTSIAVLASIWLSVRAGFTPYGLPDLTRLAPQQGRNKLAAAK